MRYLLFFLMTIFILQGCGGGSGTESAMTGGNMSIPNTDSTSGEGTLRLKVKWPEAMSQGLTSQIIHPLVTKINIKVGDFDENIVPPQDELILHLPVGTYVAEVKATDSTDKILAHRKSSAAIVKETVTDITVHLGVSILDGPVCNPAEIPALIGDTIWWVNNTSSPCTIVGGTFDSATIAPGGSWSYTFNNAGSFPYTCNGVSGWNVKVEILKWTYNQGSGTIYTCDPAVGSDGTVYIGRGSELHAINPDGTQKWKYATGGDLYSSPTVGSDGTIYLGTANGRLIALKSDGSLKWQYTGVQVYSSPAIGSDGTIYFGGSDSSFYALKSDGTLKWRYNTGGNSLYSAPAIGSDGTIYMTRSYSGPFYAIRDDGTAGTVKWTFPITNTGDPGHCPAIGSDGTIYVTGNGGSLYALKDNGTSYTQKWVLGIGGNNWATAPAIGSDGTIYWGNLSNLFAIKDNGTSCSLKWPSPAPVATRAVAIDSEGIIYASTITDNKIYAIKDNGIGINYSIKWSYSLASQSYSCPTIGQNGTIYAATNGSFFAFYGRNLLGTTPWPKFQCNLSNTGRK